MASTRDNPQSIGDLNGLGPTSRAMLARAGITSVAQLRRIGSVGAYALTRRVNGNTSLNLLWALEGALSGERWQDVSRLHRTSLLLALEAYEEETANRAGSAG